MRKPQQILTALALMSAMLLPHLALPDQALEVAVLDVPYLPQTEALCGGSAAAMILRYWGDSNAQPEDFADLLDKKAGGIRTRALEKALRGRGWQAIPIPGNLDALRSHLALGRPIIALLQVRGGGFHYVVLLGERHGSLFLHDPALGPFQVMAETKFMEAWRPANHWALLVLPESKTKKETVENTTILAKHEPCETLLDKARRHARSAELIAAEAVLLQAAVLCPKSSGPWRELAGIRALQEDWPKAEIFAEKAVAMDSSDIHAWNILATSRFIQDDLLEALTAWNAMGQPKIDLLRIDGLSKTRYRVVADHLKLRPGAELTRNSMLRASRRLAEIPVIEQARLSYRPVEGSRAIVAASVMEQPLLSDGKLDFVALGVKALTDHELSLQLSGPTGNGEVWSAAWRWQENRPRLGLAYQAPGAFGLPGIWKVQTTFEQETFVSQSGLLQEEQRRGVSLSVTDWASGWLRWEGGLGLDRWNVRDGATVSVAGSLESRSANDQLALGAYATVWATLSKNETFTTRGAWVRWRSSENSAALQLQAKLGLQIVDAKAPMMLWPGAGTGHAREPLLRAHPLLKNGKLFGETFGRQLAHANLEISHRLWTVGPVRLSVAAFLDAARAAQLMESTHQAVQHIDTGVGVRLSGLNRRMTLRLDAAWGLKDGAKAISMGWTPF